MMYRDEEADPPTIVCKVGSTTLGYQFRAIEDLQAMLKEHGDCAPPCDPQRYPGPNHDTRRIRS